MPLIDFDKTKQLLVKAIYHAGYEKDLEKSCNTWLAFRHPNGDKVIVSQKSGYTKYFNPNVTDDRGDTIDFLLHRKDGYVNTNISRAGNINQVMQKLNEVDNAAYVEKIYTPASAAQPQTPQTYFYENEPFDIAKVPESVTKLLQKRGINPQLLQSKDVAPQVGLLKVFKSGSKAPIATNLMFHFRDEQAKLVGGQYKYLSPTGGTAKIFTPGTPRERALWITSPISNKNGIFVCEDPIDALSFRQMYPDKNYALIATGGSISKGQIDFIRGIAQKFNKPLVLGNDNDIAGQVANFEIIKAFLQKPLKDVSTNDLYPINNIVVVSKNNKEQTAIIKIGKEKEFTLNKLKSYNSYLSVCITVNKWAHMYTETPQAKDWNEDLLNIPQKATTTAVLTQILHSPDFAAKQATNNKYLGTVRNSLT